MTDVVVVGGGIVGLATGWQLSRAGLDVTVLEKETTLAAHQTGRNSGVIHSGIYYKPGSLKASTCRAGKALLETFCAQHQVATERCGKVIVATTPDERPRLDALLERGLANGVACRAITVEELREREPHVRGVAAVLVEEAGIVDYRGVCARLADVVAQHGAVRLGEKVLEVREESSGVRVVTSVGEHRARVLINCAGLYSDRVALLAGARPEARIIPFRGEYHALKPAAQKYCRHLIYPVPNPDFPFLGVHLTRMVHGGVEAGPNAVLALAREGYRWSNINLGELLGTLGFPGFWALARRHAGDGLLEMWRSVSKAAFVRALNALVPELTVDDLTEAPAGVRAQALLPNGNLVDDFSILQRGRALHVLNAPSPAATASLAIGEHVAGLARQMLA
jgi:L-2-hydroxyglutarate oxidase